MKLNFGKRVVLFFHWLLSVLFVVAVVAWDYVSPLLSRVTALIDSKFDSKYIGYGIIVILVIYALLSIASLCLIFKRGGKRTDRGFIMMDSSETGKVRISVGAIEQMVKQAVGTVEGIADMRISISSLDDAIAINVNVSVVSGSHVPTVTMNMQRAIRQYVELNCGVAVRSVSINVHTVVNPAENTKRGKKAEIKAVPAVQPVADWQSDVPVAAPVAKEPVAEVVPAAVEEPVVEQVSVVSEPVYADEQPASVYETAEVVQNEVVTDDVEEPVSDEADEKI